MGPVANGENAAWKHLGHMHLSDSCSRGECRLGQIEQNFVLSNWMRLHQWISGVHIRAAGTPLPVYLWDDIQLVAPRL